MVSTVLFFFFFFFFKQKTAYDMRISDWSSDVCSSDLFPPWSSALPSTGPSAARTCRAAISPSPSRSSIDPAALSRRSAFRCRRYDMSVPCYFACVAASTFAPLFFVIPSFCVLFFLFFFFSFFSFSFYFFFFFFFFFFF